MLKIIFIWFLSGIVIASIEIDSNKKIFFNDTSNFYNFYISGSVNNPGKYTNYKYAKVIDIINSAGGLSLFSDISKINIYRHVAKEENVYIPFLKGHETKKYLLSASINDFLIAGINIKNSNLIFKYIHSHIIKNIDDLSYISGIGVTTVSKIKKWFFL